MAENYVLNLGIGQEFHALPVDQNHFRPAMLVGAIVDSGGLITGYRTVVVDDDGSLIPPTVATPAVAAVNVATASATLLMAASLTRKSFKIFNNGPNNICVGPSNVTTASGYIVTPGGTFEMPGIRFSGALYAIAENALQVAPANTRVVQLS